MALLLLNIATEALFFSIIEINKKIKMQFKKIFAMAMTLCIFLECSSFSPRYQKRITPVSRNQAFNFSSRNKAVAPEIIEPNYNVAVGSIILGSALTFGLQSPVAGFYIIFSKSSYQR